MSKNRAFYMSTPTNSRAGSGLASHTSKKLTFHRKTIKNNLSIYINKLKYLLDKALHQAILSI